MPALHCTQVAEEFAPAVVEYSPASHLAHVDDAVAPVAVEYRPALQLLHAVDAATPVDAEKSPEAHGMQRVDSTRPVDVEYRPAAQLEQTIVPEFDAKVPLAQLLQAVAPAPEKVPAGHGVQNDDALAPTAAENMPEAHGKHPPVAPTPVE